MSDTYRCGHTYEGVMVDRCFEILCPICYENECKIKRLTAENRALRSVFEWAKVMPEIVGVPEMAELKKRVNAVSSRLSSKEADDAKTSN